MTVFDIPNPDWATIVLAICGAAIIITAIICNTRTRISQQKYDYKQDIAPERFSYKLQKDEQKQRITFELYGPLNEKTRSRFESERIEAKPKDHPSTGA